MTENSGSEKKASSRNCIPALKTPVVAELRFPMRTDAIPAMSEKLVEFDAHVSDWKKACRKAFADGETVDNLPELECDVPDPNSGRMTREEHGALVDSFNAAVDADEALPILPPVYCPVERDLIQSLGCGVIRRSHAKVPPADWDESKYGSWYHNDEDGNPTIPSGWIIDNSRQRSCHTDVDKMVNDSSNNIVEIDGVRYVVAAGQKASEAAIYQIDCSKSGSYGAIWDVRRRLGLAKAKGLTNLVWRIEDVSNAGAAVCIDMDGTGNVNYFMPGQSATPGYLVKSDKELIPSQARKASKDAEYAKGIEFKPLTDPIIGEVSMDDAWADIKKAWKTSKRESTETNALVQCRVSHDEGYPFGFRGASVGIVPFYRWEYDGEKYSLILGIVVGSRVNSDYNVSKQEAKALWNASNVTEEAEEVVEEVPAPVVVNTEDEDVELDSDQQRDVVVEEMAVVEEE